MKKRLLAATLACLMLASTVVVSRAAVPSLTENIRAESFENASVAETGGLVDTVFGGNPKKTVYAITEKDGSKVLQWSRGAECEGDNSDGWVTFASDDISTLFAANGDFVLDYMLNVESLGKRDAVLELKQRSSKEQTALFKIDRYNDNYRFLDSTNRNAFRFMPNQWLRVSVVFKNGTTPTWSLYVDGTLAYADQPLTSWTSDAGETLYGGLRFTWNRVENLATTDPQKEIAGTVYLDDVKIYSGSAPRFTYDFEKLSLGVIADNPDADPYWNGNLIQVTHNQAVISGATVDGSKVLKISHKNLDPDMTNASGRKVPLNTPINLAVSTRNVQTGKEYIGVGNYWAVGAQYMLQYRVKFEEIGRSNIWLLGSSSERTAEGNSASETIGYFRGSSKEGFVDLVLSTSFGTGIQPTASFDNTNTPWFDVAICYNKTTPTAGTYSVYVNGICYAKDYVYSNSRCATDSMQFQIAWHNAQKVNNVYTDAVAYLDDITLTSGTAPANYTPSVFKLAQSTMEVFVNDNTKKLTASFVPGNLLGNGVKWESSDPTTVYVTPVQGELAVNIRGQKVGTATITATAPDGQVATCLVTVKSIPVESVAFVQTEMQLPVGLRVPPQYRVLPDNATNQAVDFFSDNEAVVIYDEDTGRFVPVGPGTATVTVKTRDGGKTSTCKITVIRLEDSVVLSASAATVELGTTLPLTATVYPEDSSDKTLTWRSDNPAVATVSQDGVVTPKKPGTATITVKTANQNKTATCVITVPMLPQPAAPDVAAIQAVAPTKQNAADGKIIGTTADMEYSTTPDFAVAIRCGEGETVGLTSGVYYIRVAAAGFAPAGAAVSVEVPEPAVQMLPMMARLRFETNGGTKIKDMFSISGYTFKLTKYVPEKEGYVFSGWYLDAALTKPAGTKLKMTGRSVVLYAAWAEVEG